jgi:CRP-like cAMP-binding protein
MHVANALGLVQTKLGASRRTISSEDQTVYVDWLTCQANNCRCCSAPCYEFAITHEFLSLMLGVRRPGVSIAAGMLQKAGLIHYTGGRLEITERWGLEAASCECYHMVRHEFARLLGPHGGGKPPG